MQNYFQEDLVKYEKISESESACCMMSKSEFSNTFV